MPRSLSSCLLILMAFGVFFVAFPDPAAGAENDPGPFDVQQYLETYRSTRLPDQGGPLAGLPPVSQFATRTDPLVRVMPSSFAVLDLDEHIAPHTWPGRAMVVWGRVDGGAPPYTFTLDFGDGSLPAAGPVDGSAGRKAYYIAEAHTYATAGAKTARLTVTDSNNVSDFKDISIEVQPLTSPGIEMLVRRNAAIQDGLRWLYLQQWTGRWYSYAPYDAAAIASFELYDHFGTSDPLIDIYQECVQNGLEFIFQSALTQWSIYPQSWGNPDSNGDGFGIGETHHGSAYSQGLVMYAIALSRSPDAIAQSGGTGIIGQTYRTILTNMVDQLAWSQTDNGAEEGGWRYTVLSENSGSDNSAVQWATIALDAAERAQNLFGIVAPPFVKSELVKWLNYSRCAGGGYGYTGPENWCNGAKTGSGVFSEFYTGRPENDPIIQNAIGFLDANWCLDDPQNPSYSMFYGNFYAIYAVKKAMEDAPGGRINLIGARDWYADFVHFLVNGYTTPCGYDYFHQVADSTNPDLENDGRWPGDYGWLYAEYPTTSWALLTLIRGLHCDLFAAAAATPQGACPGTSIQFDGSGSHSTCPDRQVVQYIWDFDASNGASIHSPDAIGAVVTNPDGYAIPPGQDSLLVTVTLWVIDDSTPPDTSSTAIQVLIDVQNHPPEACLNGPFTACVGDPIYLDGCCSFDPDRGEGGCPADSIVLYEWDLGGDGTIDFTTTTCRPDTSFVYYTETTLSIVLWVRDSHGVRSEQAADNLIWSSFRDLHVGNGDVTFDPPDPDCGASFNICAAIRSTVQGSAPPIAETKVKMYFDQVALANLICSQTLYNLGDGQVSNVCCSWTRPDSLGHEIIVIADAEGQVQECVETDNRASRALPACNANNPPDCSNAVPSVSWLWPPNHQFETVSILGVTDPDGDSLHFAIDSVTQDEETNTNGDGNFCPDALLVDGQLKLRAERSGNPNVPGNGRVYTVHYTVFDEQEASCSGQFSVCVPHDQSDPECIDDGQYVNSLVCDDGVIRPESAGVQVAPRDPTQVQLYQVAVAGRLASIRYYLPRESAVELVVYDVLGRQVAAFGDAPRSAGEHVLLWNVSRSASGIYFASLRAGGSRQTQSFVVVK